MAEKKKILVIDDDIDITESIKAVLSANGFAVFTATNSRDGVDAVDKVKPDLILCDMMMEQVDAGNKVAHDIRKKNKNVPLWLLSSIGAATAQNIELDKLGFDGVFQKPVAPDHMIKMIKKALHMK